MSEDIHDDAKVDEDDEVSLPDSFCKRVSRACSCNTLKTGSSEIFTIVY